MNNTTLTVHLQEVWYQRPRGAENGVGSPKIELGDGTVHPELYRDGDQVAEGGVRKKPGRDVKIQHTHMQQRIWKQPA